VPKVVLDLLDAGWKNLLLRTYLKSGEKSTAYITYLNVIDQLYARLMETPPFSREAHMSDEALQEWIERMLSIVSEDEEENSRLLKSIAAYLSGEADAPLETQYVPALISKIVQKEHHYKTDKPEDVPDDIWQLMLLDAGELQDGETFGYRAEEKGELQTKLAWHNTDNTRYVFADNVGHKLLDLELGEVANMLYVKSLSRLDQKSLSVTERATYHFLQSMHNKLAFQAQHDDLTGLYNRMAFNRVLDEAFVSAKSGKATHVLCYIDLDRFNIINTACGHAEGDVLLSNVARLLQETLKDEAVIGRLGGDEFGILFSDCSRTHGLKLATEVHDAIRNMRFVCENNEFKVTASIGLAEINERSDSSSRMLSAVDAAAFTAKDMGRDNIQIYNVENERIASRSHILDWVGRINVLFDKNLIQLRCQRIEPVHKTITALPHYEVLLDVHDEEGNAVPLEEFIVAAERYNRINDIDSWVVDYVLDWMEQHKEKLDRISVLSINLSGSSLGNHRFMQHINEKLRTPGFPATKVCFEVTETIAINNLDNAARFMKKLKETGCKFSLDDFGTGTSSYAYLTSLPIDYLKIDGTFVKDIATNLNNFAVVKSINEIGHAMGKETVAEYVETEFTYQALRQIGIDYVQGFGVEKPIPLYKLFG
jgi:diguanylate cyclase (GGDEF)-like protein